MEKLVSIIIPVYNSEKYLNKCIESIVNQTYQNLEIILIDDGSTDFSYEILKKWKKKDKRIKIFQQNNHGVSYTRNKGIREAKGEYISFIDADDFLDKDFYLKLVPHFNENIDIVVCDFNYYKDSTSIPNRTILESKKMNSIEYMKYIVNDSIIKGYLWNKIYKRKIIVDNKIFFNQKVKIQEDQDFNLRLTRFINEVYYLNNKLYFYRQNIKSATKISNGNELTTLYCLPDMINILDKNNIDSSYFKELFVYLNGRSIYKYKKKFDLDYDLNAKLSKEYSKDLSIYSLFGKIKIFMIKKFPKLTYFIYNILKI